MTNEEAIEYWEGLRKTFSSQLEKEENHFGRMHLQTTIDAIDMAISALRQKERFGEANKTLTLDELRQMPIRDWVWIDVLHSKETVSSYYRKYDGYKKDEIFWCGYPGIGFRFFYEDYGKTWLAYRQKPEEDDRGERKENENVRR